MKAPHTNPDITDKTEIFMTRHKGEARDVTISLQDFIIHVADPAELELYHEFSGHGAGT